MGYKNLVCIIFIVPIFIGLMAVNPKSVELPEVTVKTHKKEVLHILGYLREYSTLTTYTDTIFLFREKTVDFMIPTPRVKNFKGWLSPRLLASRSYYRFSANDGTDSVSNTCRQHFSWSDWVGITDNLLIPEELREETSKSVVEKGKYSNARIWERDDLDMTLKINMLADSTNASWAPNLASYIFRNHGNVEFSRFNIIVNYKGIDNTLLTADNINNMSYDIETTGRARKLFRAFATEQPYFVNTHAELYIIDREFIPASLAKKWEKKANNSSGIGIYAPQEAGEVGIDVSKLIARVNEINHTERHLKTELDYKVAGMKFTEQRYSSGILGYLYKNFGFRF